MNTYIFKTTFVDTMKVGKYMSNEEDLIYSILRTKPLPGADLKTVDGPFVGLDYFERVKKSGKLTVKELRDMFAERTVARVESGGYDLTVVTRPEFDAPPGRDHMVVAIPTDENQKIPWDYYQLAEVDPIASIDFVRSILTILKSYRNQGCTNCLAVLNTSAFDDGLYLDDQGIAQKKRLSQSVRVVHGKAYGYRDTELIEDLPTQAEKRLIVRPLQEELNALVQHVADRLNIAIYDEPGFAPLGIKINDPSEFPGVYARVHEFMTDVAGYVVGPDQRIPIGDAPTIPPDQLKFVHGVPLNDPPRATRQEALKNITHFSSRLKDEYSPTSEDFHHSSTYFDNDDQARILVAKYLEAVAKVITKDEKAVIPIGPQFTVLFELLESGETVAFFVPADYVPKGANPVSGILPAESHRPITRTEKRNMRQGANNVIDFLAETFGDDRVIDGLASNPRRKSLV